MEMLTDKIKDLEKKSTSLEKQNIQLKSEKDELKQQVQDLLAILSQVKNGGSVPENYKRFKASEYEEPSVEPAKSGTTAINIEHCSDSASYNCEGEDLDLLSSGDDDLGALKAEHWLNQNDIISQVKDTPVKRLSASTKGADVSLFSGNNLLDETHELDKANKFVLDRGDGSDDVFSNIFGESVGNMFNQASMLTLNIVM